jgi:leader peptidase (prepilin peptidase) / N-methyltransferase
MVVPLWIWLAFIFAFGCCIGSFLNVVIYRLPLDKSLITPPSSCPACNSRIRFYDNIPLISWLLLAGKCRDCKTSISPRYFLVELLTGLIFSALFVLYFRYHWLSGMPAILNGGWFIYLLHITLLATFIAASAIDLQLWIIPMSLCWFAAATGLIASCLGVYVINPAVIRTYSLLPSASANTAAMAAGAAIGLAASLIMLKIGLIKESYKNNNPQNPSQQPQNSDKKSEDSESKTKFYHYREIGKEIIFLLPIIVCSLAAFMIIEKIPSIYSWWVNFSQTPVIAGLLGSLWGYFIGCAIIWITRILGTLLFGKEAMGLGDMHLMGAAGAIIGPVFTVVAFFVAPFFGLAWAAGQTLFLKKIRQIPYGPFLSLGVFTVMILHDGILNYLNFLFFGH